MDYRNGFSFPGPNVARNYWSSTTSLSINALGVHFFNGFVLPVSKITGFVADGGAGTFTHARGVRGGQ